MACVVLCPPAPVSAWGCKGHETIALLARKHLGAPARRMVDNLLDAYTVDSRLKRFCHPSDHDRMIDGSTWADDVRKDEGSPFYRTGDWHFIDIPRSASGGDLRHFCPRRHGCLISALKKQI